MKKTFTFLAIFSFLFMSAQYNDGIVYLKDSTELKGLIKIRSFGGIKFKPKKDSKATFYDYNLINGFDTESEKYRYIKHKSGFPPKLLKENIKGKIYLYSNEVYNPGHTVPNGFAGGGMSFGGGTSIIYFIQVNNKLIRIGARIKKKHLKVFNDCTRLIRKIENREFKKREVYKIIEFYNKNCD